MKRLPKRLKSGEGGDRFPDRVIQDHRLRLAFDDLIRTFISQQRFHQLVVERMARLAGGDMAKHKDAAKIEIAKAIELSLIHI